MILQVLARWVTTIIWICTDKSATTSIELNGSINQRAISWQQDSMSVLFFGVDLESLFLACLRHGSRQQTPLEEVEEEALGIKDGDRNDDDDKDDQLEFGADGSVVVNKLQLQSIRVNQGLAKLKVTVFTEIPCCMDQTKLHKQCISHLKAFHKTKSSASNFHQQHLAIGLESMPVVHAMCSSISNKLDHLHEDLVHCVDAMEDGQNNQSHL